MISLIDINRLRHPVTELSSWYMLCWIDASCTTIDYDSQLLSMALSTRTCRVTFLIIVVRLNVVYRSHDRFVHAFRETCLWLICGGRDETVMRCNIPHRCRALNTHYSNYLGDGGRKLRRKFHRHRWFRQYWKIYEPTYCKGSSSGKNVISFLGIISF